MNALICNIALLDFVSLKNKAISGIFWISLSTLMLKILNFVISIVLARLLEPSDFGLIAIALIVVNFFETFRDLGIGSAIIHQKEDKNIAVNTGFFMFPVIALIFYLVSYFIAPISADFFKENELTLIIRILSLTFIIWSFGNLPRTLLSKNLEFKKMLVPQILPKICYGAVAIVMAFQGFGIWSLIWGRLVLEISSLIAIWSVSDWKPSLNFNKRVALELLSYGRHVIAANITVFLISVIDITVIGRILGSEVLGYYSLAIGISNFFTSQISVMISQVMFPIYSKMQDDLNKMSKAYLQTLKYLSFVTFPATVGIISVSWYFIKVVYGDKWLPATTILNLLCLYGLNRSMIRVTQNLFLASGNPKTMSKVNFLQLFFMAILIYPLTAKYGIFGTSIAALVPSTIILLLTLNEAAKLINQSFLTILKILLPAATGSIIMFLSVTTLQKFSYCLSSVSALFFSIFVGASSYLLYFWLFHKDEFSSIKKLVTMDMSIKKIYNSD